MTLRRVEVLCRCEIPRLHNARALMTCGRCNGAILGAVDFRVRHTVTGDIGQPSIPAGSFVVALDYRTTEFGEYHEVTWLGEVYRVAEINLERAA